MHLLTLQVGKFPVLDDDIIGVRCLHLLRQLEGIEPHRPAITHIVQLVKQ